MTTNEQLHARADGMLLVAVALIGAALAGLLWMASAIWDLGKLMDALWPR